MFKTKTLKTILIIFAVITVVGVTAGLLGGLRSDGGSEVKDSHTHDFEVISSVPGTCTTPGSETLKCKSCNKTETRETATAHTYNDYSICTACGDTPHELVCNGDIYSYHWEELDYALNLGAYAIDYHDGFCPFLVVLNQGKANEESFYALYSIEEDLYHCLNPEVTFIYDGSDMKLLLQSELDSCGIDTVTVYQANPNVNYVQLEGTYDVREYLEIKVDGKIVDFGNADAIVLADVSEITFKSDYYDAPMVAYYSNNGISSCIIDFGETGKIVNFDHFAFINFECFN